ncbi:Domain of unknown function (DUF1996) [Seminavis robusta]|uniref:DUF1996 domain-containing protein n=1 Tax=Seminavis robusta TaxID=568900 RepID=A0A9N8EAR3_9STRA|nr:Domain of unknown function (DUF1996) [Seminavis robusta]|eukprot:Sro686_g187010.1 Domain of unknown function (DUF1996) (586) ;mRNA; r:3760-5796
MKLSVAVSSFLMALASTDATSIKMDFLPIGHVRTDPILSKTCLSGHVHSFYGAQVLPHPASTDYDALRGVTDDQNTGNVVENKSLYWHPSIYSYDETSNTFRREAMAQTSAYYVWITGQATAFPNGFQMIGGMPDQGAFSMAEAECVNSRPSNLAACPASFGNINFFPTTSCDELEASMKFPNCWDGENLSSANGREHVAYTTNGEVDGPCPSSHPVRLPQIIFFFRIMPYKGGCHVFSDMTQTFHADYVSGWDDQVLQRVLDNCSNDSLDSSPDAFCEEHLTFRDGPKCSDPGCDFGDASLMNKLRDIQPPPIDMKAITDEEVDTVVGTLPGGPNFVACSGPAALLPPTAATTLSPSPYPSFFPGDGEDEDEDGNEDGNEDGGEDEEGEGEDGDEDEDGEGEEDEDGEGDGDEDGEEGEDEEGGDEDGEGEDGGEGDEGEEGDEDGEGEGDEDEEEEDPEEEEDEEEEEFGECGCPCETDDGMQGVEMWSEDSTLVGFEGDDFLCVTKDLSAQYIATERAICEDECDEEEDFEDEQEFFEDRSGEAFQVAKSYEKTPPESGCSQLQYTSAPLVAAAILVTGMYF